MNWIELKDYLSQITDLDQDALHIYAAVLGDPAVLRNRAFVESLDLERLQFAPEAMRLHYEEHAAATEPYPWKWNPDAAARFLTPRKAAVPAAI